MNDPFSIYPNCGTTGGYTKHRKYKTVPCTACNEANNRRVSKFRSINTERKMPKNGSTLLIPSTKTARMPVEIFYTFFNQLSPQSQGKLMKQLGPNLVNKYLQAALDTMWNNEEIKRRQKEREQ